MSRDYPALTANRAARCTAYNSVGLVARMKWRDASTTYFFYDGALQRYGMNANGTMTYFLWSGLNLLQELNLDGTVKEEHTNAMTPVAGIGQVVETYRPAQIAALQKIYPIMDMRGTITKWVESDGTTILASREYDAFGTIIPNSAVGTWPGRFGYQGQAWLEIASADQAQRLLISPTRLYNPTDGIFIQRDPLIKYMLTQPRLSKDPLSLSSNMNLYVAAFVPSGTDPLGLEVTGKKCPAGKVPCPIPDFKPVKNGCGAKGKPGAPNKPVGADFTPACDAHDICYGTCGKPKEVCDNQFRLDLKTQCEKARPADPAKPVNPANPTLQQRLDYYAALAQYYAAIAGNKAWEVLCYGLAEDYYKAVAEGGDSAYNTAQDEACTCCCMVMCPPRLK